MSKGHLLLLMVISIIWGSYSIIIGVVAIHSGYNNDLLWISIIGAVSGTTGAHIAISLSPKGLEVSTSGPQDIKKP